MRSRRPVTSITLIAGAALLLGAIALGQRLGDRVLSQATDRRSPIVGAAATPVPETTDVTLERDWKRRQVVSVATDPAFPDPRVTRPPTPRPTPPPPTPRPTPTEPPPTAAPLYTSPPLPLPLVSHAPGEIETEPPAPPTAPPPAAVLPPTAPP